MGERLLRISLVPFARENFACSARLLGIKKLEKLGEGAMLVDLAKRKKWRKCPTCNYHVEKSAGCCYVRCRVVIIVLDVEKVALHPCQLRETEADTSLGSEILNLALKIELDMSLEMN
ncbi:hypothetical protein QQP08_024758 [Theobroma cacao]|nr:hypothetical protein QQP08_024758 [Theobroma cacao]